MPLYSPERTICTPRCRGADEIETEGLDVIERLGKRTCGSRTATALQEFSEVDTARQQINLPAVFLGAD